MHPSLVRSARNAVPVHLVTAKAAKAFLAADRNRAALAAAGFAGRDGELMPLLAGAKVAGWVLGLARAMTASPPPPWPRSCPLASIAWPRQSWMQRS